MATEVTLNNRTVNTTLFSQDKGKENLKPAELPEYGVCPNGSQRGDHELEKTLAAIRQEDTLNACKPLLKKATDGRVVRFYYSELKGLSVFVEGEQLGSHQLPRVLREIKTRKQLEGYLRDAYLVLRGKQEPFLSVNQRGRGGSVLSTLGGLAQVIKSIAEPFSVLIGGQQVQATIRKVRDEIIVELGEQGQLVIQEAGKEARLTGDALIRQIEGSGQVLIKVANQEFKKTIEESSITLLGSLAYYSEEISRRSVRGFVNGLQEVHQSFWQLFCKVYPYRECNEICYVFKTRNLKTALGVIETISYKNESIVPYLYQALLDDCEKGDHEMRHQQLTEITPHLLRILGEAKGRGLIMDHLPREGHALLNPASVVVGPHSPEEREHLIDLFKQDRIHEIARQLKGVVEGDSFVQECYQLDGKKRSVNGEKIKMNAVKMLIRLAEALKDKEKPNVARMLLKELFSLMAVGQDSHEKKNKFFSLIKAMKEDEELVEVLLKNEGLLIGVLNPNGEIAYDTFADRILTVFYSDPKKRVIGGGCLKKCIADYKNIFHLGMRLKKAGLHGEMIVKEYFPRQVRDIILYEDKGYCFRLYNQAWGGDGATLFASDSKRKNSEDHYVRADAGGYDHRKSNWKLKYIKDGGAFPFRLYNQAWNQGKATLFASRSKNKWGDYDVRADADGYDDPRSNWLIHYLHGKGSYCFRISNQEYGGKNSHLLASCGTRKDSKDHFVKVAPGGFDTIQSNWNIELKRDLVRG